jgi:hypothetical protein
LLTRVTTGQCYGSATGLTSATKTRNLGLRFPFDKSPMTRQRVCLSLYLLRVLVASTTHTHLYIIKVAGMASSLVLERDDRQRNRVYVEYLLLRKSLRTNRPPLANIRCFNNAII